MGRPLLSLRLLLALAAAALAAAARDYYDLLQVPRGADEAVIKRSFRKLALKYHPVRGRKSTGSIPGTGLHRPPQPRHAAIAAQDKATGSEAEKAAAQKQFQDISHGMAAHAWLLHASMPCTRPPPPWHAPPLPRSLRGAV